MNNNILNESIKIAKNLLQLSKICNDKNKEKFVKLSTCFIIWLTSNYSIDFTEEIILYSQDIDIIDAENINEIYEKTLLLLKKFLNKLLFKKF